MRPNSFKKSNPRSGLVISATTNVQENDLFKLGIPISRFACPWHFIFSPLAVVSDTGVGFNVTPFNLDAGIIEILAPVSTINFNVVVPNRVLICNSGELRGTDMVRVVSFPSLLELV